MPEGPRVIDFRSGPSGQAVNNRNLRSKAISDTRKPPLSMGAWQSLQISRPRLTAPEQLVGRFIQTPFGTADI